MMSFIAPITIFSLSSATKRQSFSAKMDTNEFIVEFQMNKFLAKLSVIECVGHHSFCPKLVSVPDGIVG